MEGVIQGYQSLSHSKWDCKSHIVFIRKKRREALFGQVRRHLGEIFHALAQQKECQILEGHFLPDHVRMCIAIPPKHPVALVIYFCPENPLVSPLKRPPNKPKMLGLNSLDPLLPSRYI